MSQILGIKFTDYGQPYYFTSGAFVVSKDQYVLVKTEQGLGLGQVVDLRDEPPSSVKPEEIKSIYRLANEEDLEVKEENDAMARASFQFCRQCIRDRELDMKLVDVEVFFDRSKLVFYFTAPGRIDFRDLVKDLVREFRTRIELRQIGVRHETQMLGAIGNCGQLCCCRRFMRKFHPVTIKMAKEQNLFLNPTKISGICGRLLCCLGFEQKNYEEFHKRCPRLGKKYDTAIGRVKVFRSNFFRRTLSVFVDGEGEREIPLDEWEEIFNKRPPGQTEALEDGNKPSRSPKKGGTDADSAPPPKTDAEDSRRPPRRNRKDAVEESSPPKDGPPPGEQVAPDDSDRGGVFGLKAPETVSGGDKSAKSDRQRAKARSQGPRKDGRRGRKPREKSGRPGQESGATPQAQDDSKQKPRRRRPRKRKRPQSGSGPDGTKD